MRKQYCVVLFILSGLCCGSALCLSYNLPAKKISAASEPDTVYAGSAACMNCHKDIYNEHIKTAHYLTSGIANERSVKGSFKADSNTFVYNKFMKVVMEQKGNHLFQSAYASNTEYQRESFDIVIGSARKGQTYLYWQGNKLFQLPVSYYAPLNSWCNSPGYNPSFIYFDRPIPARCLECHSTNAKAIMQADSSVTFDKQRIIFGVDCERCHGSGEKHVAYHTRFPKDTIGKFIIRIKDLARAQQLDACALCHSGIRKAIRPAFSFSVGDKLDDYSLPAYDTDSSSWLDVHGNQYGLLTASKCFKMSDMVCSSCHNVHKEEVNEPQVFSSRCMRCHNQQQHSFCSMKSLPASALINNCITCHMPLLPSKKIFLQMPDKDQSTPDLVRTHRIAIYPEETKKFIDKLKQH
jgi:hypothetical protein